MQPTALAAASYTFPAAQVWLAGIVALTVLVALLLAGLWTAFQPRRLARPWLYLLFALAGLFFIAALVAAGAVLFDTIRGVLQPPATGPNPAAATGPSGPNLGAGALIAALLGAPFVIWGTVLKYQTVRFQKEGHITERISQAVEQLGAEKTVKRAGQEESLPNIEVRIGGLLSLERISQDSVVYDKGRDHVRVMEVLCAYIRNNAPASEAKEAPGEDPEELPEWATAEAAKAHAQAWQARGDALLHHWAWALPKPRADIQLALDIIGRRGAEPCAYEAGWRNGNVAKADWPFGKVPDYPEDPPSPAAVTRWQKAFGEWKETTWVYSGYRLDLRNTNLQGADLQKANLSGARLENARMQGADLGEAQIQGASLRWAQMQGTWLFEAQMQGARLGRAQMQGANLWRAQMQGAGLSGAQMQGAGLIEAQLHGANLSGAQMQGADLTGAQMRGADLSFANLSGAYNLTQTQIDSAEGDAGTRLPPDLTRPGHWR